MASPEEMGAYYEGYPDPDDSTTWGHDPQGHPYQSFEDSQAGFESAKGPAPAPSPVPGPPSPGAGMPAARLTDLCAHGGAIIGPGEPTVLIGFMPAARAMPANDQALCPMFDGLVPHVSGVILTGSTSVLIGNFPAARVSDPIGPPSNCKGNAIAKGEPTVLIGTSGSGGGGGGGSGGGGSSSAGAGSGAGGDAGGETAVAEDTAPSGGASQAGGGQSDCTNPECAPAFKSAADNGTPLVDRNTTGC